MIIALDTVEIAIRHRRKITGLSYAPVLVRYRQSPGRMIHQPEQFVDEITEVLESYERLNEEQKIPLEVVWA